MNRTVTIEVRLDGKLVRKFIFECGTSLLEQMVIEGLDENMGYNAAQMGFKDKADYIKTFVLMNEEEYFSREEE